MKDHEFGSRMNSVASSRSRTGAVRATGDGEETKANGGGVSSSSTSAAFCTASDKVL